MKTLKELQFEITKDDDLYKRLENKCSLEQMLNLTQEQAAEEEVTWHLGDPSWYDFVKGKIEKFGGRIVWE